MGKVAVVTGSNKGIGLACVRALCKQLKSDDVVYLTARDLDRGQKAVEDLKKEGLSPHFHQLDISDKKSIEALRDDMKSKHGGLDILINNAAIAFKVKDPAPFNIQAKDSVRINYLDTLQVCHALFPLLRSNARVVNVSSIASEFTYKKMSPDVKQRVKNSSTESEVTKLLEEFVQATEKDNHNALGFPSSAYGMSKVGVSAVTRIQGAEIAKDKERPGILIMSTCPGYVSTDMSSFKGTKTPDEGADTLVFAALLPPESSQYQGKFLSDRQIKEFW